MSRHKWAAPPPEDPDDPWRSIVDDIFDWLSGPRVVMVTAYLGTWIFSFGVYFALGQSTRSGYFCFDLIDSRVEIIILQWVSLVADVAIIVLFWQVTAWIKSLQTRLQTIGSALLLSCLLMGGVALVDLAIHDTNSNGAAFGSLHLFDVVTDGLVLAWLFGSTSAWFCEEKPLVPVSTITVVAGIWASLDNIRRFGDWTTLSRSKVLFPFWAIFIGASVFIYFQDQRTFIFIRRPGFIALFFLLLSVATISTLVRAPSFFKDHHPIDDLIFKAQAKHDHWLKGVKLSDSLPVAVRSYQNLHDGRPPPPHFSDWYEFAEGSAVIDQFQQIERDLSPFWDLAPQTIRDRVNVAISYPGVTTITIKAGKVLTADTGDDGDNQDLEELGQMIRKFSKHLPDMVLPINLRSTPRILPKWGDPYSQPLSRPKPMAKLVPRGAADAVNHSTQSPLPRGHGVQWPSSAMEFTLSRNYGQMQAGACPPASRARNRPDWKFGELCVDCAQKHSQGPLIADWEGALDVCDQPDLFHLHAFPMLPPLLKPIEQLLPLFGPSKTKGFKDIIVPMPKSRLDKPDKNWQFERRYDALFWRGTAGKQVVSTHVLRGSHKYRFLHLVSNPGPEDEVSMILPTRGHGKTYVYERIPTQKANADVPFTAGLEDLSACLGAMCQLLEKAYGTREDIADSMEYRYVLLLDEDDGPPPQLLRALRSNSVPFISTIFRTWYTERLTPWLHFVPIDVRYQSLHTSFAYFSGTVDRPPVSSTSKPMEEHVKNAEWIVEQGKKWAKEAIGERDMEIYLFRLLLEWGRLINDRRNEMGFRVGEGGQYLADEWI